MTIKTCLLALLSATLLAACGGGDIDAEEADAAAAMEEASALASRAPMGGGRRAPICTNTAPDCQPNLPPTQ